MTSDLQDIPDGHKPFGLKTTQPLPPSVAELRDIIAAHYRGDALNQLCALASRAEPAPVADEAAIEAWERDWDAATRTLHFRIQRDEFDGVRAMGARAVRLMRAAPRNDVGRLRKLLDLAKFVVDCDDFKKSPSDLLVVFDGRFVQDIRKLLAESPAGDAGESEARGLLKEAMGAFEPWVRGPGVVGGILHLQEEVGNLRTRLQAAEAERDALAKERDWERHEWPKQIAAALHTEVGTIGATPSMVATAVQLEHEAHTRCLDRLVKAKNELAAAKAEGAKAVVDALQSLHDYFGGLSWGSYSNPAIVVGKKIAALRAAQPQPTTAAPAATSDPDSALRNYMQWSQEANDANELNVDELALRELCRRALEGKP